MRFRSLDPFLVLRGPEGGGGGTGGSPPPPPAAGGGAAGGSPPPPPAAGDGGGSPPAAGAYRPEGLPDHLYDADPKAFADKLFGAYKGARDQIAQRGAVPEAADKYTFAPPPEVAPYFGDVTKDPAFVAFAGVAHKHGLTDKQFGPLLADFMGEVKKLGIEPPVDIKAEHAKMFPDIADAAAREQKVNATINDHAAWIDTLGKQNPKIGEAGATELSLLLGTAAGVATLAALREQLGQEVLPAHGDAAGGVNAADLQARLKDPRNDNRSPKFDRAFAEETDRLYRDRYGSAKPA